MRLQAIIGKREGKLKGNFLKQIEYDIREIDPSNQLIRLSLTDQRKIIKIDPNALTIGAKRAYLDFMSLNNIPLFYCGLTEKGYTIIDSKLTQDKKC